MRTLLVLVALATPIVAAAVDRDIDSRPAGSPPSEASPLTTASYQAAAAMARAPVRDALLPTSMAATPELRSPNAAVGPWPGVQGLPTRPPLNVPALSGPAQLAAEPSRLPQSGPQWYALIAAGIAAIGFMARRRTRG